MKDLSELVAPERLCCQCDVQSKKRALQTIAELLSKSIEEDELSDIDIFDALLSRERLGNTSLGHGVALPHSRLANLDEPLAAMITVENGVDYDAVDNEPVDIVVGLLVPEHCNDEHLQILANMAKRFNNAEFRQKLRDFEASQMSDLFNYLQQTAPVQDTQPT